MELGRIGWLAALGLTEAQKIRRSEAFDLVIF
jgi:hypothetical protein